MAKNNAINLEVTPNADGFSVGGGTTKRTLTLTGADVSLTGSGSAVLTFPTTTDTIVGRATTDTLTNKTIDLTSNTLIGSVTEFNTALESADFYTTGGTDVALADGGTGASLTDPGADRIMFWDDSAGVVTWLTAGSGLTITDTTISATGGGTGDVTSASTITDNAIVRGDGGAKGVQQTGVLIDDSNNLLMPSGTTINFNSGDVVLTHAANKLTLTGGTFDIGTPTTTAALNVQQAGTLVAQFTNTNASSSSAGAGFVAYHNDGAAMASGDRLAFVFMGGASDAINTLANAAGISAYASEAWSGTATGTTLYLETTPNTSTTRARYVQLTSTALSPFSNDLVALGTSSLGYSDLFLASGGVLNFNNGDVTITHAANTLTFAGASTGYIFDSILTVTEAGTSTITGSTDAEVLKLQNDSISSSAMFTMQGPLSTTTGNGKLFQLVVTGEAAARGMFYSDGKYGMGSGSAGRDTFISRSSANTLRISSDASTGAADLEVTRHILPVTSDGGALGSTTKMWGDLFLASGAVLNFDNGNAVITHSSGVLTVGTGDLRVTTAGTNSASVVTVDGTQTLTNKTLTSPTINASTITGNQNIAAVPATDHTANGPTTSAFNLGATVALMETVYLGSGGKWLLTDASAAATASGMLGICLDGGVDTDTTTVALAGSFVRDDTWAWTVGAPIYLSETAGALTETQPTTTDAVIRVVGFAVSADVIYFLPESSYITHT